LRRHDGGQTSSELLKLVAGGWPLEAGSYLSPAFGYQRPATSDQLNSLITPILSPEVLT
jgi:hypothetical protein